MCGTNSVSFCFVNIDFLVVTGVPSLNTFLYSQDSQPHFLLINFLMSGPVVYHILIFNASNRRCADKPVKNRLRYMTGRWSSPCIGKIRRAMLLEGYPTSVTTSPTTIASIINRSMSFL